MDKTYLISIEGQSIPVPAEIGADDAKVKAALAPYFPDAANAMITRSEKDGQVAITVVKKAGSKGAVLDDLRQAESGQNPAVALYLELQTETLDALELLQIGPTIDQVLQAGQDHGEQITNTLAILRKAKPTAGRVVPTGF